LDFLFPNSCISESIINFYINKLFLLILQYNFIVYYYFINNYIYLAFEVNI
jgi:hypothetical protein